MQGIGSDAGYQASSAGAGGGLDPQLLGEQLSKASLSALSYVSTVWETTTKVNTPPPLLSLIE